MSYLVNSYLIESLGRTCKLGDCFVQVAFRGNNFKRREIEDFKFLITNHLNIEMNFRLCPMLVFFFKSFDVAFGWKYFDGAISNLL